MSNTIGEIIKKTIKSMPVEVTDGEAALFNSLNRLSTDEVVSALQELIQEQDSVIASRAFDALLKLEDFDKVQYLLDLYDQSSANWRFAVCANLSKFPDKRAVQKLCEIVLSDDEPDLRYVAAEALAAIGDETAIPALDYVKEHDAGTDYEGRPVSEMAEYAIQCIHKRSRGEVDNP